MALGLAIKRRMKDKKIGNKDLSEMTGISLSTLNNIIYGVTKDPSVNVIMQIAKALDCSLDELVEDMDLPELTLNETYLLNYFRELNAEGQELALKNIRSLVKSGEYIKNDEVGVVGEKQA